MDISAGIVIIIENKILLVKPKGLGEGFYSIPKGLLNKDETILSAAIRETYEETGILVYEHQIDKTPHICNYVSNSGRITKRVFYFIVKLKSEELKKTGTIDFSEIESYDFYERNQAEKLIYWKMMSILNHLNPSKFSTKELFLLEKLNIINRIKHPLYPIFLYNYTEKCKRFQFWNDTTLWCRGLVLDLNGNVIARPFKKFFEEHQIYREFMPSKENPKIFDKIDGALGIMFLYKNKIILCNRQNFKSRQAIVGAEILYEKYARHLNIIQNNRTYLFEIIYPNNRFVVNYGTERDLFLLGITENTSGKSINENNIFKRPQLKEKFNVLDKKNEGVVIHYENDFKLKIKNDSYVKRYKEINDIKQDIAKSVPYLYDNDDFRENWNVDYNKLYKLFQRKYLILYLKYYSKKSFSETEIKKIISSRKIFGG